MNYVFQGPMPVNDPELGLIHPGDVRDFEQEPDQPPWKRLSEAVTEASAPVISPPPASPLISPAQLAGIVGGQAPEPPKGM